MLEVARAHYPELLTEAGAPAPAPAPRRRAGRRTSTDSSDDDESLDAKEPAPASARYAVGDAVEARWKAGLDYYPAIVIGVRAVRGFGVVDLQYSDGSNDKEWGVVEALIRPSEEAARGGGRAGGLGRAPAAAVSAAPTDTDRADRGATADSGRRSVWRWRRRLGHVRGRAALRAFPTCVGR